MPEIDWHLHFGTLMPDWSFEGKKMPDWHRRMPDGNSECDQYLLKVISDNSIIAIEFRKIK